MISRNTLSFDLKQAGILDADQLKIISIEQAKTGKNDQTLIKELGFMTQSLLQEFLAKRNNLSFVDLQKTNINKEYARLLDKEYCQKHKIILFDIEQPSIDNSQEHDTNQIANNQTGNKNLPNNCISNKCISNKYTANNYIACIAMSEEIDIQTKDALRQKLKMPLKFFLCNENALLETLDYVFSLTKEIANWVDLLDEEYKCDESFATRLIYELIVHCIKEQVSDIHIEPEEFFVRIRLRKDGLLKPLCVFPKEKWPSLCVRIKMLANMDITQSLMPQDGRFDFTAFGRKVDLRISSRPIVFGENIVIRLLDTYSKAPILEELGYSKNNLMHLYKIMKQTSGVFIVTGPTGSGKSTLLFSMLTRLAKPSVSVATIEDPVEYRYAYLRQTDINTYKNMSFANALKSILRQDPDIVAISEIRDSETALMAMRAAMTGRMLFTTLHTNDIFGIFDRLIDLGVDRRMLINHLNGVATQRLVRKVCPHCCKQKACTKELSERLNVRACNEIDIMRNETNTHATMRNEHIENDYDVKEQIQTDTHTNPAINKEYAQEAKEIKLVEAIGCNECDYTGYKGRIAVSQVLFIDDQIKELLEKHTIAQVKKILYGDPKYNLLSLEDELRLRVCNGETTLEEAERVMFI